MSINPPSDIVLDVARAADPARSVAATERLAKMAAGPDSTDADFSDVVSGLRAPPVETASLRTQLESASMHSWSKSEPLDPQTKAYRGFEAMVLQNLVETMLPSSEEFFGEGTAGLIWKSMLADQLGTELAKKVDLGIGPKHAGRAHSAPLHRPDAAAPLMSPVDVPLQHRS